MTLRYEISLPHSVYLPPSFKREQIDYPTPTAEEVRRFCFQTGGMLQGGGVSQAMQGSFAFGLLNFDQSSAALGQNPAKYAMVTDRRRVHRFQQPGTNPHLLRFLLEDVWQLYQPRLLIDVTGSAQGIALDKIQWAAIVKAVMGAAKNMNGWVFTGGTDVGVMKLMGEGRCKFAPEVSIALCSVATFAIVLAGCASGTGKTLPIFKKHGVGTRQHVKT